MKLFRLLIAGIFLLSLNQAKAQHYTIGIGPELNFPTGNSGNLSSIGVGGAVKVEYGLSPKFGITASGGYNTFFGRNYFGKQTEALNLIPVKTGFKYYSEVNFYFEAQLGAAFPLNNTNSNVGLVWSPGFGTYIKSGGKKIFDVGLRYEGVTKARLTEIGSSKYSTFSFIGVRMAYTIKFLD